MMWKVYAIAPIDFGWWHLHSVEEVSAALSKAPDDSDGYGLESFLRHWQSAQFAAQKEGWEGDFRQGPCVFWLPKGDGFQCNFVFKQDNNGETFVVSQSPLPWLE